MCSSDLKENIRELEGALIKVVAYASLKNTKDIDVDLASEALKELIIEKDKKVIDLDYIKEVVANFYSINVHDLYSKSRAQNIVFPRHIAMYISRMLTDFSLIKISESFNRDHSTLIHAIEKIENLIIEDETVKDEIDAIVEKIQK